MFRMFFQIGGIRREPNPDLIKSFYVFQMYFAHRVSLIQHNSTEIYFELADVASMWHSSNLFSPGIADVGPIWNNSD